MILIKQIKNLFEIGYLLGWELIYPFCLFTFSGFHVQDLSAILIKYKFNLNIIQNKNIIFDKNSMKQEQNYIKITGQLSDIYPDIEGELCSKQSTLFGKLKQTFNKLYDGFDPTHYVITQGVIKLFDNKQVSLGMALQNGMTILLSKTYPSNNIYINGNHFDQQLIYSHEGDLSEGLNQSAQPISSIIAKGIQGLQKNSLMGGIIYIHGNIPQNLFGYKKSLLIGIFLSILILNKRIQSLSISQIIDKLVQTGLVGDQEQLQQYFYDYQKRKLALTAGVNNFQVPLQSNLKMIFCRLDLAKFDIDHNKSSRKLLSEKSQQINLFLKKNYGVDSIYQAYQEQITLNQSQLPGNKQESKNLIDIQMKELNIVCQYSNQKMGIQKLLEEKWKLDTLKNIHTPEVIDLVQSLSERVQIKACAVVEGQFAIIAVQKQKYTQLICVLRQALHKGELKSKSFFKIDQQLVENRWGEDLQIGQKIFASAPSLSIGIFDPNESIWFE